MTSQIHSRQDTGTVQRYIDQFGLETLQKFSKHIRLVRKEPGAAIDRWLARALETGQAFPWEGANGPAEPAAAPAIEPRWVQPPDLVQAHMFLTLLDLNAEAFTFQTFLDRERVGTWSRGPQIRHGTLDRLAPQLVVLQDAEHGVFVVVNETDLKGRKTENVIRVRAVFADLDGAPIEPVMVCGLQPHFTVESSPGKYHAYWRVDGLALDQFKAVQQAIAARFGGDKAVHDLPRVMRLPGFWHQKRAPFQTRVLWRQQPLLEPYPAAAVLAEFPPPPKVGAAAGNGAKPTAGAGAAPGAGAGGVGAAGEHETVAELVRLVMTAESYHDPLVKLAYRFVMDGMAAGKVVETLQGLMLAVEPHDERWQARYDDIERTVETAVAKRLRPAANIISEWQRGYYQPAHRNPDQTFHSLAFQADIPLSKIHSNSEVLNALRGAIEAQGKGGVVKDGALPGVFNRFKDAAYGDLLDTLPLRDDESATIAAEEIEVLVTNLLNAPLMRHPHQYSGTPAVASLGSWAKTVAYAASSDQPQAGAWRRVADLPLWGKLEVYELEPGKPAVHDLVIGFRPELAARMKVVSTIANMTPTKLTRTCRQAKLNDGGVAHVYDREDGAQRATILRAEFVRTLGFVNLHDGPLATEAAALGLGDLGDIAKNFGRQTH